MWRNYSFDRRVSIKGHFFSKRQFIKPNDKKRCCQGDSDATPRVVFSRHDAASASILREWTDAQMDRALRMVCDGSAVRQVSNLLQIPRSTLRAKLKTSKSRLAPFSFPLAIASA